MKATEIELGAEYAAAVRDYLAGKGEEALRRAQEAGRHALASGLGVLELAAAHRDAILEAVREMPGADVTHTVARALTCFAESLSPFEAALRGAQESDARLRQSQTDLERAQGLI